MRLRRAPLELVPDAPQQTNWEINCYAISGLAEGNWCYHGPLFLSGQSSHIEIIEK